VLLVAPVIMTGTVHRPMELTVVAGAGLLISGLALLATVILLLVRMAIESPDIFSNNSRKHRQQTQRRRTSRRARW